MTIRAPASSGAFCWYLDASFCAHFHKWHDGVVDVILIGRIVCWAVFGLAALILGWVCWQCCYHVTFDNATPTGWKSPRRSKQEPSSFPRGPGGRGRGFPPPAELSSQGSSLEGSCGSQAIPQTPHATLNHRGSVGLANLDSCGCCGGRRFALFMDYLSVMPSSLLLLALFWLIFAPVFYFRVFQPCWDCYDFEATVAHEVGHVLGFHHPDALWQLNLNANRSMRSCALSATTPTQWITCTSTRQRTWATRLCSR